MTPRNFREKLETVIIVTVITALVWLYAEATVLQQVTSQPIQVRYAVPPGQEFAVLPFTPQTVRVSFKASSGQVQEFRALTASPITIEIEPRSRDSVNQEPVVLEEALLEAALLDLGIAEVTVDPPTQQVTLKPLRTIDLRVEVDKGAIPIDANTRPVATPSTVRVVVPIDTARDLRDSFVSAKLASVVDPANTTSVNPGAANREQVARDVPLEFPAGIDFESPWTQVSVERVQVNYILERPDDEVTLERIPLFVNMPVGLQQEYAARPSDEAKFLLDVTLQGPSEIIDRIRANDPAYPVRAELRITDYSQINELLTVPLQPVIVAPPGVTPVKTPDLMNVNVRRRPIGSTTPLP